VSLIFAEVQRVRLAVLAGPDQVSPGRAGGAAHRNFVSTLGRDRHRRAHHQVVIGKPTVHAAGIDGVQSDGAALEVDAVDVHQRALAQVHRDQDLSGEPRIGGDDFRADALPWRQVADIAAGKIHREDVRVLVAVGILTVENRLGIPGPTVPRNPAAAIGGNHARVLLADGLHPDLQDSLGVRRDPGELFSVRGDLGHCAHRIAEQDFARDQGRQLGARLGHRGHDGHKRREDNRANSYQECRRHWFPHPEAGS
jgi:hypothetical protein